jgi:transcriptional regulator of aromatic amino acid metabolism
MVSEIATQLHSSRSTVAKYLEGLYASGQAELRHVGRAKIWYLRPRLPLKALLEINHNPVIVLNNDKLIVQANKAFLTLIKRPQQSIRMQPLTDFAPFSTKDVHNLLQRVTAGSSATLRIHQNACILHLHATPITFNDSNPGIIIQVTIQ